MIYKMTKDKMCMFFASDYHFEMISLLSIRKEIKDGRKIVILSENNLTDTMEILLSRVNFEKEEKKKIQKIDWTNKNKIEIIKEIINENKKITIYIKGGEEYIQEKEKELKELENNDLVQTIYCYDIEKTQQSLGEIRNKYNNQLITKD